jgi:hypothetical protein
MKSYAGNKDHENKVPIMQGVMCYFPKALTAVARVSQLGRQKYGSWGGWRSVTGAVEHYGDAKFRHGLACSANPRALDEESKLLHAAHEAWNALARLELILMEEENDPPR